MPGHHFFTKLLLPAILDGAQSSQDKKARIITVSSGAHYMGKLHWDTFVDGPARKSLSSSSLYNQSKYVRRFSLFTARYYLCELSASRVMWLWHANWHGSTATRASCRYLCTLVGVYDCAVSTYAYQPRREYQHRPAKKRTPFLQMACCTFGISSPPHN